MFITLLKFRSILYYNLYNSGENCTSCLTLLFYFPNFLGKYLEALKAILHFIADFCSLIINHIIFAINILCQFLRSVLSNSCLGQRGLCAEGQRIFLSLLNVRSSDGRNLSVLFQFQSQKLEYLGNNGNWFSIC